MLRRRFEPGQYTSIAFTERLAAVGALASIGTVGDAFDNVLAENDDIPPVELEQAYYRQHRPSA